MFIAADLVSLIRTNVLVHLDNCGQTVWFIFKNEPAD